MYMMFPSYKLNGNKLEYYEYDNTKSNSEQTKEALQNRLIELYKSVLLNENVIGDVMTPIDFDHMKNDIRSIFKQQPISNLSLLDPLLDIDTKYSFLAGKSLVGQFANMLTDYVLGSLSNINIINFDLSKGNTNLDEQYSQELDEQDMNYYLTIAEEIYKQTDDFKKKNIPFNKEKTIKGLKKIKIKDTVSALLNGAVDIAKDPYITEGNWGTMTANTGGLLVRKGVHPFYVNAFLAQPIITKYIEFTQQYEQSDNQSLSTRDEFRKQYVTEQLVGDRLNISNGIELSELYNKIFDLNDIKPNRAKDVRKGDNSFTDNNILRAVEVRDLTYTDRDELDRVKNKLTEIHSNVYFPTSREIITNNSLKTIRDNINDLDVEFQAKVLNDFLRYQNASKALKMNIDASKFMVNGMGKNITSLNMSKNLVDSILFQEDNYYSLSEDDKDSFRKNIITGFNSKFINPNGSNSMFSNYYDNIILKTLDIVRANPKLFLSANPTVQNTFNEISYNNYNDILIDDKLGTELEKTFYSYVMSGFQPFNISIEERRDLVSKFPKTFKEFKENNKGLYRIVDELTVKVGEGKSEFISLSNRKKSKEFEDNLINSWTDLLNDEPEIAENLIKYSYFSSGFAMNMNQFYTYIPYQWFIRNKVNRFIIDQSKEYDNYDSSVDNFIDQFYLSNLTNRNYVKITKDYKVDNRNNLYKNGQGFINKIDGKSEYYTARESFNPITGETILSYYKLLGYNKEYKAVYSRYTPNINNELIDVKPLHIKGKNGQLIVNYNTEGIILKATNKVDNNYYNQLVNEAIYPRDYFYKENYVNEITISIEEVNNNLNEEDSPCKGGIDI